MDKWEYCILAFEKQRGFRRAIYYLDAAAPDGIRRHDLGRTKVNYRDTLKNIDARLIARLGADGWELVQISDINWFYFKRRIDEPSD